MFIIMDKVFGNLKKNVEYKLNQGIAEKLIEKGYAHDKFKNVKEIEIEFQEDYLKNKKGDKVKMNPHLAYPLAEKGIIKDFKIDKRKKKKSKGSDNDEGKDNKSDN